MVKDWTIICRKYRGLWVALKDDEQTVIASGKTVKDVMDKARQKKHKSPILFRVPTRVIPYVGGCGI